MIESPSLAEGGTSPAVSPSVVDGRGRFPPALRECRSDLFGLLGLSFFLIIALAARFSADGWMTRVDLLTQFIPWSTFLGEQLREFNVPGWDPFLFSGRPFAGDPQSGWMYLPTMISFVLFSPLTAWKSFIVIQMAAGAFGTYALIRVLGMGPLAAVGGATAFACGPFLHFNTYCCTVYGEATTWTPIALLGVELTLRGKSWPGRGCGVVVTGIAISQFLSGYVGQGTYYAALLTGSYIAYRTLIDPPIKLDIRQRAIAFAAAGASSLAMGVGLGAAGILIRLDANRYSNIQGGDYSEVQDVSENRAYDIPYLLDRLLSDNFSQHRREYLTIGAVVLAVIGAIYAFRKFGVPYFVGLTAACVVLATDETPFHAVLYTLLPRFQSIHEHAENRIYAVMLIAPAVLAAAGIESLKNRRLEHWQFALLVVPLGLLVFVDDYIGDSGLGIERSIFVGAIVVTVAAVAQALVTRGTFLGSRERLRPIANAIAPVILILTLFYFPTGREIKDQIQDPPARAQGVRADEVTAQTTDPGGAGEYLQSVQSTTLEPIRFFGYAPDNIRTRAFEAGTSYHAVQKVQFYQRLLNEARPMRLELYSVQGYDPMQIQRYVWFLEGVNGIQLNYHDAYVRPTGIDSPLLGFLRVQYFIAPHQIAKSPFQKPVTELVRGSRIVFSNTLIDVIEIPTMPYASIVHQAVEIPESQVMTTLLNATYDPLTTVIIESAPPNLDAQAPASGDQVSVVSYEPDEITLSATAAGDGMLVISEVYFPGWRAYVDGEEVDIFPSNYIQRGVALPAGEHTVVFRYDPLSLKVGLWLTAVSVVAALSILIAAGYVQIKRRIAADASTAGSA